MVDLDVRNSITPTQTQKQPSGPSIPALKAAISGSAFAARYPAAFMYAATYNDLVYICRLHSIVVAGIP